MDDKDQLEFIKMHISRLKNPFYETTPQEYGWNYLMEQIKEIISASDYNRSSQS